MQKQTGVMYARIAEMNTKRSIYEKTKRIDIA